MSGIDEEDESDSDDGPSDEEVRQTHPNYPRQGDAWNGRPGDDQTEARLAEALQRDRQQSANGHGGSMDADSVHAGRGYQQDEYTGMITTNAGVQMDPKKRKRVRSFSLNSTASAHLSTGIYQPHQNWLPDVSKEEEEMRRGEARMYDPESDGRNPCFTNVLQATIVSVEVSSARVMRRRAPGPRPVPQNRCRFLSRPGTRTKTLGISIHGECILFLQPQDVAERGHVSGYLYQNAQTY